MRNETAKHIATIFGLTVIVNLMFGNVIGAAAVWTLGAVLVAISYV